MGIIKKMVTDSNAVAQEKGGKIINMYNMSVCLLKFGCICLLFLSLHYNVSRIDLNYCPILKRKGWQFSGCLVIKVLKTTKIIGLVYFIINKNEFLFCVEIFELCNFLGLDCVMLFAENCKMANKTASEVKNIKKFSKKDKHSL